MVSKRKPLLATVAHCRTRRGPILWNASFRLALLRLAKTEGLLGDLPGEDVVVEVVVVVAAAVPDPAHDGQRAAPRARARVQPA